jgi:hypothetical protein
MTQFKWVQSSQCKNFGGIRYGSSSMRVLAYCLRPNHFHMALWPRADGDVGRWMHWLMTTHVRRYQGGIDPAVMYGSTCSTHILYNIMLIWFLSYAKRAQSFAMEAGWASRRMGVVEPALALLAGTGTAMVRAGPGPSRDALNGGCQCCHDQCRTGDHSRIRAPGSPVRNVRMDDRGGEGPEI